MIRAYLLNILYALDMLAAAICGGDRYQTLSAIVGLSQKSVVEKITHELLDAIQPGHAESAADYYMRLKASLPKD